jgi:hypothetical protein
MPVEWVIRLDFAVQTETVWAQGWFEARAEAAKLLGVTELRRIHVTQKRIACLIPA